jgi:hypothetical protein
MPKDMVHGDALQCEALASDQPNAYDAIATFLT